MTGLPFNHTLKKYRALDLEGGRFRDLGHGISHPDFASLHCPQSQKTYHFCATHFFKFKSLSIWTVRDGKRLHPIFTLALSCNRCDSFAAAKINFNPLVRIIMSRSPGTWTIQSSISCGILLTPYSWCRYPVIRNSPIFHPERDFFAMPYKRFWLQNGSAQK